MKRKVSITKQFMVIIWGIIAFTMITCWCFISFFSETYYRHTRLSKLEGAFDMLDEASKKDRLESGDFHAEIDGYTAKNNISLIIIDDLGNAIYTSQSNPDIMFARMIEILMASEDDINESIIKEKGNYTIISQVDGRTSLDYMSLFGNLEGGETVFMSLSIQSIRESINIYNRYIAYIGILIMLVSAFLVFFVSKGISRPIEQLTQISRRMSELDFEAKYVSDGSGNEIDELGLHMNEMSENLEHTIGELKQANVKLKEDLARRERTEERRTEFLSGVSHELKTPIAIIQGYAEGLEESVNDDEESRNYYCRVIKEEASKMNRMVQAILDLTHLEYGQDYLNMVRFNIIELLYGLVNASDILIKQEGITVSMPKETAVYVWADESLIEQVASNYISNAIHYCKNEKQIRIFCEQKDDIVRISIFNSGDNIEDERSELIWEKFYKGDVSRTREYGGSGIGLSVVKAVMDVFGRDYGFINEPDGVTFWFELESAQSNS